jgi:serine/threonine protein kinase
MQDERWELIKQLVSECLNLGPDSRQTYLAQACPDMALRAEVETLLLSFAEAGDFMEEPAMEGDDNAEADASMFEIGERIGHYRVLGEIGRGGMGVVYRAVRADDYEHEVALKVIKRGLDTDFVLERFRFERQILAKLEHTNIARLLDGGSTQDGRPYFVMELVRGQPLDRYCDEHRLNITSRLRLFRQICSAVSAAHQNLVVHRDIKPGNILVTSEGVPKLLDFGIAKILQQEATAPLRETITAIKLLTPDYASPEQLEGGPITTASDVYSLGVVLYELLTGHRLRNPGLGDQDRPSTAVMRVTEVISQAGEPTVITPESVSVTREGTPDKLRRRLSGDLDNIILMALRKEPQRRYSSVEQFSQDIGRHLESLPVLARADTFPYLAAKFIKRHQTGVVAAALVALSLVAGLAVSLHEAHVARLQEARAEHRFNDVRKLANSLIFEIHDSIRNLPGSTGARKVLVERAVEYLDSLSQEAHGDTFLQRELATAYERVGDVQGKPQSANLGDSRGALESYQKAHAIRKALATAGSVTDQVRYAVNSRTLGYLQLNGGNASAAVQSIRKALAVTQASSQTDPSNHDVLKELASDYQALGDILTSGGSGLGDVDIEGNFRKALAIDEKLAATSNDPGQTRSVMADEFFIGRRLRDTGHESEAVEVFRKALAISQTLALGGDNAQAQRDVASVHSNMGDTLMMSGRPAEALGHYQKSLQTVQRLAAADPDNQEARSIAGEAALNVGTALAMLARSSDALKYLNQSVETFERTLTLDSRNEAINLDLAVACVWRAGVLSAMSDPGRSLENYRKALVIGQGLSNLDPGNTSGKQVMAGIHAKMGDFFRRQAQPDAAAENYRQAIAIGEKLAAADSTNSAPRYVLADAYSGLGDLGVSRAEHDSKSSKERFAHLAEAKSWYLRSSDAWRQIAHPDAVSPDGFAWGDFRDVARALALVERKLSGVE